MRYTGSYFCKIFICILFCSALFVQHAIAKEPIIAKIGFYFKTVSLYESEEAFAADFYWWVRVDGIDDSVSVKEVKNFEFVNGTIDIFTADQEVLDWKNKYYYATGRCKAKFPFKSDYRSFPFDSQKLSVKIENTVESADAIKYVFDLQSYTKNKQDPKFYGVSELDILNGSDHNVLGAAYSSNDIIYKTNFGDPTIESFDSYSRFEADIIVGRNPWAFFLKISLPLFVILFLSYLVFFIPDTEIGTASALTVTSLLAAIAFQWTISETLPKVTYLTFSDKIFYLVYLFVFYAMAQTIFTFNLSKGSDRQKALSVKIELFSRWAFPLTFIAIVSYLVLEARN